MTDRDLRKMNRKELLEMLIALQSENDQLKERLRQQAVQLRNRDLQIKNAGSIAEAALALNGVFESVDKAAEQYLESIKRCSEQQQNIYDQIVSDAEQKAEEILDKAENEKQQKMRAVDEYWKKLRAQLEVFYQEHEGLKEYLQLYYKKKSESK